MIFGIRRIGQLRRFLKFQVDIFAMRLEVVIYLVLHLIKERLWLLLSVQLFFKRYRIVQTPHLNARSDALDGLNVNPDRSLLVKKLIRKRCHVEWGHARWDHHILY